MRDHLPCYGNLFPSAALRQSGMDRPESVFGYVFQQCGTVARPPQITVDLAAWDRCVECQGFSTCMQLSAAKLLLEMAVRNS
jgi:hypothetical protein